jgi:predicted secreted protein
LIHLVQLQYSRKLMPDNSNERKIHVRTRILTKRIQAFFFLLNGFSKMTLFKNLPHIHANKWVIRTTWMGYYLCDGFFLKEKNRISGAHYVYVCRHLICLSLCNNGATQKQSAIWKKL